MEVDLDTVATTAATTLARAVVTDSWEQLRRRLGRLLGRGDRRREAAALTQLKQVGVAGDPPERILRRLLRAHLAAEPASVADLADLVAQVQLMLRERSGTHIQAGRAERGGVVIQAGGNISIGTPPCDRAT